MWLVGENRVICGWSVGDNRVISGWSVGVLWMQWSATR